MCSGTCGAELERWLWEEEVASACGITGIVSGRLYGKHEKGSEQKKTDGFSSKLSTVPTTQVWFSKFPKSLK